MGSAKVHESLQEVVLCEKCINRGLHNHGLDYNVLHWNSGLSNALLCIIYQTLAYSACIH